MGPGGAGGGGGGGAAGGTLGGGKLWHRRRRGPVWPRGGGRTRLPKDRRGLESCRAAASSTGGDRARLATASTSYRIYRSQPVGAPLSMHTCPLVPPLPCTLARWCSPPYALLTSYRIFRLQPYALLRRGSRTCSPYVRSDPPHVLSSDPPPADCLSCPRQAVSRRPVVTQKLNWTVCSIPHFNFCSVSTTCCDAKADRPSCVPSAGGVPTHC